MEDETIDYDLISDAIYRQTYATAKSVCNAIAENGYSKVSRFETECWLPSAKIKVSISVDYD